MSGYIVMNEDKVTPVQNLSTGIFLVKENGGMVVDLWASRVVYQK
jgi:hypothetical protein